MKITCERCSEIASVGSRDFEIVGDIRCPACGASLPRPAELDPSAPRSLQHDADATRSTRSVVCGDPYYLMRRWVEDGALRAMPSVNASLSADHRVADGHRGALFLCQLREVLQRPAEL